LLLVLHDDRVARTGRPKAELVLTDIERETLTRWARRRTSSPALALRCRIVPQCATGASNKDVAARLGVGAHTVSRWRDRFVRNRLEGLPDEPRPGGPRTITDAQVEEVVVRTVGNTPNDATHWSTCSMAGELGLSQSAVSRIWRAYGLKPHLADTCALSKDPQFIEKSAMWPVCI
jgi:transposase